MILKLAVSADDKIGAAGHKPVAITGEAARTRVHLLRAQCDAILVGIGTVLADDPLLTCRLPGMDARRRSGWCWIARCGCRAPASWSIPRAQTPLWVMTSDLAEAPAAMKLGAAGAQVMRVAATTAQPPGLDLPAVLHALSDRDYAADGRGRRAGRVVVRRRPGSSTRSGCCAARRGRRGRHSRAGRIAAVGHHRVARVQGRASESLGKDTLTVYERV